MVERPRIALTGATGFVGRKLLQDIRSGSLPVRALVRAPKKAQQEAETGVEWISGDLASDEALSELVHEADAVIHLAGVTKARNPEEFREVNAVRTAALVKHAQAAGVRHFVHVSSLTAQRPDVSAYARSKADSETLATENAGPMALTIIRAPAVLGPGDDATRPLFSALARGILPVPAGPAGTYRFSIVDVADLARFLLSQASAPANGISTLAPAGHLNLGWSDITQSAERVLPKTVRRIDIPPVLMKVAGQTADLAVKLNAKPQVFSGGKVRELLAGDWIADTQIPDPTSLDQTLRRCLAPFLRSARGWSENGKE